MSPWSYIILEGYCMFDHLSKKKHTYYEILDWDKFKTRKTETVVNKDYIPPKERPSWCVKHDKKRIPQFRCLCYGNNKRCPFFAMTNAEKADYRFLNKKYKKDS